MGSSSKVIGQHTVWKAITLLKEGKNKSVKWLDCLLLATVFCFLLTHWCWLMAWPYCQKQGQWKTGLLNEFLFGAQPYGNCYANLKGAVK